MAGEMDKRLQRGWILLDQHRYAQAEAELAQALAGEVDRVLALYWLGWAQFSQGKYAEAEITLGRCIGENPARGEGYHGRAVLLRKMGDLVKAEEAARLALQKDHWTVEYRAELAWILLLRSRPQEALELVNLGLDDEPQSVDLHRARTQCFVDLGKLDEARQSALKVLSLDPEEVTSRRQLGNLAFQQKDYEEAQKHYAEALRLEPGSERARTGLLNALRHRFWFYRLLVPKRASTTGRGNVWFYAIVATSAAMRAVPTVGLALGFALLLVMALVLVRWYLGATVGPVTTLLLRMNPIARRALPPDEIECSTFAGLLMFAALFFFAAAILGFWHGFFAIGLFLMLMVAPLTKTYQAPQGFQRTVAEAYAWLLFSVGCGGIAAMAQKMYEVAAFAFIVYGCGALTFEPMTRALGRMLTRLSGRASE